MIAGHASFVSVVQAMGSKGTGCFTSSVSHCLRESSLVRYAPACGRHG